MQMSPYEQALFKRKYVVGDTATLMLQTLLYAVLQSRSVDILRNLPFILPVYCFRKTKYTWWMSVGNFCEKWSRSDWRFALKI